MALNGLSHGDSPPNLQTDLKTSKPEREPKLRFFCAGNASVSLPPIEIKSEKIKSLILKHLAPIA
jgi:hypothetical protein